MAKLVQQSTANDPLFFFLVLSSDHLSPATGKTPTVTISKNGAAFGAPAGAVTEMSGGWYQVAGNATDTATLGDILLHATEASSDNCDMVVAQVVSFNPRNANLGLSNVSANVAQWNGSNVVVPNVAGEPLVDLNHIAGAALSTHASGMVPADVRDIAGAAVSTTSAQLGVNVVQYNAQTAQTDTNNLPKVDVEAINASTTAAVTLAENVEDCPRGTCSGGTTATAVVSSMSNPASLTATGQLIGRTILFDADTTTAALQSQASNITNSTTGATPTITFTAMTTAPANGDTFSIV